MKKIAFVYYRSWAFSILLDIIELQKQRRDFEIAAVITTEDTEERAERVLNPKIVHAVKPEDSATINSILNQARVDLAFFYSWSWIIPEEIISKYPCICLHPSRLPNFRGGSPIQNQVLSGLDDSAVSIFRMASGIDDGPIYRQGAISLHGPIQGVFDRMASLGKVFTRDLLADLANDELQFQEQAPAVSGSYFKRRKPADSALTIAGIESMPFRDLCRFVDVLGDPYPNAFLPLKDGKLLIRSVLKYRSLPSDGFLLTAASGINEVSGSRAFLKLADGFALVSDWTSEPAVA
jgi:methionyl-tRNA formyltransferase